MFGNVRDQNWLTDGAFEAGPDTWRFVIDYPFDEDGRSSLEDLNRVETLRAAAKPTRTVVWVPHFLSTERRRELGRLVILDWLLGGSGERWTAHSDHLAEADRVQARIILETQRDSLRQRLRRAVQEAYGAATATPGTLERLDGHDRVLFSLHREFDPAAPVGHDLAAAFANLVEQAFAATFPGHPRFEPEEREVTRADLAAVLAAVEAAGQDPDGRAFIEPGKREAVRRVANPLGVGHMGETHFLFGSDRFRWDMLLSTAMGRDGMSPADPVAVRRLRDWINAVSPPAGLRPEVTDLIICAWAVLHTRAWYRYNAPVVPAPAPGSLAPDMELRPEPLPAAGDWEAAVARAGVLFGTVANPYLTGQAVTELTQAVSERAAAAKAAAAQLVTDLERVYQRFGIDAGATAGRLATARSAHGLVAALTGARDRVALVEALARHELAGTAQATAKSLASAQTLVSGLASFPWERLRPIQEAAASDTGERGVAALGIVDRLRDAVAADELAQSLLVALKRAEDDAFRWALGATSGGDKPRPGGGDDGKRRPARGARTVASQEDLNETVTQLKAFAAERAGRPFTVEWRAEE